MRLKPLGVMVVSSVIGLILGSVITGVYFGISTIITVNKEENTLLTQQEIIT